MSSTSFSRQQRKLITQLQQFTGASFRQASETLRQLGWDLEVAADTIFSQDMGDSDESEEEDPIDVTVLETWFSRYADEEQKGNILTDGLVKFCEDLEVDPEDVVLLVISEYMKAEQMLEYSKEEFFRGMQKLGTGSKEELKAKLPELREQLNVPQRFRQVYTFTYAFARQKGQKSMLLEVALPLWKILLKGRFQLLNDWCTYLEKNRTHAITKDEWNLLLEFVTKINGDISKYDEDGAWPVVIDDFVDHMKKAAKS